MLGKPTGYSNSPRRAPLFYALCVVGIGGGMTLSLLSVNPITLLVFVAVINGVAAAPFLAVTMLGVLGPRDHGHLRQRSSSRAFSGWGTVALMSIAAVLLLVV